MSKANLKGTSLREANLQETDLSGAKLIEANLKNANLSKADLSHAVLRGADLSYADLSYADLREADLSYADIRRANLLKADFRYSNLSKTLFYVSQIKECNLENLNLDNAIISQNVEIKEYLETVRRYGGMKDLIQAIAMALVDKPENVSVTEVAGNRATVLELKVAKEDLGKIIGKQGRTAKAIRTILNNASVKNAKRTVLEIIE
jgi:predicted RNA-binding protein YlqC (UPF0109 family)